MRFSELVQYFRRLEGTSGRNALVEVLAELFARTPTEDVPPTRISCRADSPYFEPVEIGLGNNYVTPSPGPSAATGRRCSSVSTVSAILGGSGRDSSVWLLPAPIWPLRSVGSSTDSSR